MTKAVFPLSEVMLNFKKFSINDFAKVCDEMFIRIVTGFCVQADLGEQKAREDFQRVFIHPRRSIPPQIVIAKGCR